MTGNALKSKPKSDPGSDLEASDYRTFRTCSSVMLRLRDFTMSGETSMAATTLVALFSTRPSAARQLQSRNSFNMIAQITT